ncbi:MAG: hypothetical protein HY819_10660 [Acidobacteria bacterium]|nr:hypothetical protein [Acidobacteriota bacterium]
MDKFGKALLEEIEPPINTDNFEIQICSEILIRLAVLGNLKAIEAVTSLCG